MFKIGIIVGSKCEGYVDDQVAKWILEKGKDSDFSFLILYLRE